MKKFTTSFAAIIFALFILTSCGAEEKDTDKKTKKSANKHKKDIKVEDLKELCDFADAMLSVATEMKTMKGEVKEGEKETPEQKKRAKALMKKMAEISDAAQNSKLDLDDMQDCPSMKKLEKL